MTHRKTYRETYRETYGATFRFRREPGNSANNPGAPQAAGNDSLANPLIIQLLSKETHP